MPGFCSPVDHTMPEGVSAIRGVEVALARAQRDASAHEAADLVEVGERAELAAGAGAARRDHHRRGQDQPVQVDGEGALHPGHERTTGSPSGGVGIMRGASDSHRSHRTRAGLKTGPSTQARRWS